MPILRDVHDAEPHRVCRALDVGVLAGDKDLAGIRVVDAKQDASDLGATSTYQARKPDDFATPDLKRDIGEDPAARQAADLESDLTDRCLPFGKQGLEAAANHMPDGIGRRELGDRSSDHVAAVTENAYPISDLEDLFHAVVDEQDGDAPASQLPDDREEPLHLAARESRRRLVHHKHSGIERKRLGDLDQLLIGDRQPSHRNADPLFDPQVCKELFSGPVQPAPVDSPNPIARQAAGENVLSDG